MIALTPLILVPASGQDGPPLGYKASAAAAPTGSATQASSAAAQKTAPAAKAGDKKAETSPKAEASAKAGDPAANPTADPPESAGDPPKADAPKLTGVAAECADLLNLAKALKTEVDKTTQDVLSVAVVRDANKIEHMAHKMRDNRKH